jgi:hypothetical protein
LRIAAAALVVLALAACGGEEEEPPAAVADIMCTSEMLTVTPRVRATTHGVHVEANVSNERGVSLAIDGERVRGEVVLQLAPGRRHVICRHPDGGSTETWFEVVPSERAQP